MNHICHLNHEYFELVRDNKKSVEVRLNDEKRQNYHVGDIIKFVDCDTDESVIVKISGLSYYYSFDDLIDNYPLDLLGFYGKSKSYVKDVYHNIYNENDEKKYHVVAINFELL